jgi:zinc protease
VAGMFQMSCTAAAGVSLAELEAAIRTAVTQVATGGPTPAEMERALAQTEAQFLYRLQTIGGFGGKSDQLNAYNTYLGDPGYFDRDRQRYIGLTAEAVTEAARQWLQDAPLVALSVVPRGRRDLALAGSTEVHVS